MNMEYRAYIAIPTFPGADHDGAPWERLLDQLNAATDMGPVISGPHPDGRPGVEVILAADADDEAGAARVMFDAVAHGLEAVGLGEHYPASIKVERADADQLVTA